MWGVRNGPPYPLDAKTHARVKKQKNSTDGFFKDIDADLKQAGWNTMYPGQRSAISKDDNTAWYAPAHKVRTPSFYENKTGKSLTGWYHTDAQTLSKMSPVKNPSYLNDDVNDYLKSKLKQVNPSYSLGGEAVTNNCAKCAATMTLMKMGYNNIQAGRSITPMSSFSAEHWFKNGIHKKTNNIEDIKDALLDAKNGSFGTIGVGKLNGDGERISGHAMSWTKTRNGKIRIEDGQNGRIFDSVDEMMNAYGMSRNALSTFNDLTNATPNWQAIEMDGVCGIRNNERIVSTRIGRDSVDNLWPLSTNYGTNTVREWTSSIKSSNPAYTSVFNTPMSSINSNFSEIEKLLDDL